MNTTIYLTRHGQTLWNLEKRLQGRGNSPLTEDGIERAKELRDRLKNIHIDIIYSSPIERAFETAKIIKGDKDVEIITDDGFMEMCFGDYDILEQSSPEVIRNVVFPIRKCSGSPEAAHDRAALTIDTALDLIPVNRTFSLFKRIALFKHGNLTFRLLFHQLIRRKDPSRTCSNNDHIIIHTYLLLLYIKILFRNFFLR